MKKNILLLVFTLLSISLCDAVSISLATATAWNKTEQEAFQKAQVIVISTLNTVIKSNTRERGQNLLNEFKAIQNLLQPEEQTELNKAIENFFKNKVDQKSFQSLQASSIFNAIVAGVHGIEKTKTILSKKETTPWKPRTKLFFQWVAQNLPLAYEQNNNNNDETEIQIMRMPGESNNQPHYPGQVPGRFQFQD